MVLNLELINPVTVANNVNWIIYWTSYEVISEILVSVIYLFFPILILCDDMNVLVVNDNSDTKDDVLELVDIENMNTRLTVKSVTRSVLLVEIVLVFCVLIICDFIVRRTYTAFTLKNQRSNTRCK